MRKIIMLIMLLMLLAVLTRALPAADETLTLRQAVAAGLERSLEVQNLRLDALSAETELDSALLKKWFSLDAAGSYMFKSEQMEIAFIPGKTMLAGARHNYDLNVALKQPLYTGGRITNGIELNRLKHNLVEKHSLLAHIELAARIKTSFYTCRLLMWKKNSLESLLQKLNLHLQRQENLFAEAMIKKSDILETRRRIKEQELTIADIQRQINDERILFHSLCGFDAENIREDESEETAADWETAQKTMTAAHPVFSILERRDDITRVRGKLVKGEYLPQVTGFAELHYGKPGLDFFKNQWMLYFQGGVALSFRIFDWQKKNRDLKVLDYEVKKTANERADLLRESERRLKQLYDARRTLLDKLAITEELEKIAAEEARLKEESVLEQQISNIDYLDAQLTEERYRSMRRELTIQVRLIDVAVNRVVGKTI